MSERDTVLGAIAAFAISAGAFAYLGVEQAIALASPGSAAALQLAPLAAGGYAALVGVGLLIGARLMRAQRAGD